MTRIRTRSRRLGLLRTARKKIAAVAKPAARRRLAGDLKRLNQDYARLKQAAAAGTLPKREAKRALGLIGKIRRELRRLTAATAATTRSGLVTLDRIERIRKEG
jgi:hypothetical protein